MATATSDLRALKRANDAYIEKHKANGRQTAMCNCPHCHKEIERLVPRPIDVGEKGYWDGMTQCVHCGDAFFHRTYPNGKIETLIP